MLLCDALASLISHIISLLFYCFIVALVGSFPAIFEVVLRLEAGK
jgi:hypothetical protein